MGMNYTCIRTKAVLERAKVCSWLCGTVPDLTTISEPVTGWLTNNVDKVKALAQLAEDDTD